MSNDEALAALITGGDPEATVAFFAEMPEATRRQLAAQARDSLKQCWDAIEGDPKRFTSRADRGLQASADCATVAVWATATASEFKKLGWRARPGRGDEHCFVVMAARQPPWLGDWCDWLLAEWPFCWTLVRELVKAGHCPAPASDAYVLGMVGHLGPYASETHLADALEAEPDLLEGLFWRIFEVEGGGDLSLAAFDKYSNEAFTWKRAVLDLVARERIERDRVLDASLDALNRGFSQFRAGWYSRLHEALKPSLEERAARRERYLNLLASPIPPTVSLSLKALKQLQTKKQLPAADLLAAAEPALYAKSKASASTVLKLIAKAAKTEPALAGQAAALAALALEHSTVEVQEEALALLEALGDPSDGALRESVTLRRELVSPSQQGRIDAWLGESYEAPAPEQRAARADSTALQADAAALDKATAERLGIPALLGELEAPQGDLPAIDLTGAPRLAGRPELAPVSDLGELIDLALEAIERTQDMDLSERAFEGLARLYAERPEDFERRVGPLRSRLAKLEKKLTSASAAYEIDGQQALAIALKAWLGGELPDLHRDKKNGLYLPFEAEERTLRKGKIVTETQLYALDFTVHNRSGLLLLRAWVLGELMAAGITAPLLSVASHSGGWLAPAVLVERAAAWAELGRTPALPDLVLGLLRLAPEGRAEALAAAKDLPGEGGAALRYALGNEETIGEGPIGKTAPLWVAACRARAPFADDPAVAKAFPKLAAGGGRAARYRHAITAKVYEDFTLYDFTIVATPELKDRKLGALSVLKRKGPKVSVLSWDDLADAAVLLPTVEANRLPGEVPDRLSCGLWPANPDALFAEAALDSHGHEEENRPAMSPVPASLGLLLEPEVALTPMALMLLCQALNARDKAEGQLAGDVLIAVIEDGRLAGPELGATLKDLLKEGIIKPKRWIPRLKAAAQVSPLHRQIMRRFLETALAGTTAKPPRDIAAFLEQLLELCVESQEAVAPALAEELTGFPGSGKAAKLARKLAALKPGNPTASRRAAAEAALKHRLARAARWRGSAVKAAQSSIT